METFTTHAPEDWNNVARIIRKHLRTHTGATVITLKGTLGAGKTTFTQALARVLGVTETVVSPTFVIMQSYTTSDEVFRTLVHIDAYRIEHESEAGVLHLEEYLNDPHTLILIEWPENIPSYLPEDTLTITIDITPEDGRIITLA